MKRCLVLLTVFCFAFCMLFTACANVKKPENTTEQSTTEQSTADTTQKKIYPYYYTSIRETKALQTEASELQEKLDRNDLDLTGFENSQQKVIVQIGDQRDVPYIFECGGGHWVSNTGSGLCLGYYAAPSLEEIRAQEEYIPVYTYTGSESFTAEFNDETVKFMETDSYDDGESLSAVPHNSADGGGSGKFDNFEQMCEELSAGKYYVTFTLTILGNHIYSQSTPDAEPKYGDIECTFIEAVFILEIK